MTSTLRAEIRDLDVAYGSVAALRGFSLALHEGEAVVLTGRSGCGKSTVLRALAGLLGEGATVNGTCEVAGLNPLDQPLDLPRTVGYVPQNPAHALFCTTVGEEVASGPRHLGLDDPRGRARWAMQAMGCENLEPRLVRELSSGQQQRVAIAAALAAGPRLLLMDEPTSYLDQRGLAALAEAIAAVRAQGVTLLVVEHRLDRLPPDFDRVIEMEAGLRRPSERPFPFPRKKGKGRFPIETGPAPHTNPTGEIALKAERLTLAYGKHRVLEDVDLQIQRGERVALLGDNGVGKTTLARALAGLLKPTSGRVANGQGKRIVPGVDVGLTTPSPTESLFCDTVAEEVAFGPANFALPVPTPALIETMRLAGLEGRRPTALSLGQQQRVSVAAAVATAPRLLILDEPTIGQDPDSLEGLLETLAALSDQGVATLIVTHDHAIAAAFASRILRLENGRLLP